MLPPFYERHAFSIRDEHFLWFDVALAAIVRGDWPSFERRLAESLACAARDADEGAPLSQEALDAAAIAFRYDRDLISAADLDGWLDGEGLSVDDWLAFVRRNLLREQWRDQLEEILDRFAPSAPELLGAAVAEGRCTGLFQQFERTFAGHAAFVLAHDPSQFECACRRTCPASPVDDVVAQIMQRHAHWFAMRPAADTARRLATVAQLEKVFGAVIDTTVSETHMREIVEAHRLEWTRCEMDTLSMASESAAREALLCVKADGLSLYDVAALSRRPIERTCVALEEVDGDYRERLLAAAPGDVLGPVAIDGRFNVIGVVSRIAPAVTDPAVAARARHALVDMAVQRAARDHVTRPDGN